MIGRAAFIELMSSIRRQYERDYEVGGLITKLGDPEINNNRFVFTTQLIDDALRVLATDMNDVNGWISYYVYELEFGAKADEFHVIRPDKSKIALKNAAILYDFMVKEQ